MVRPRSADPWRDTEVIDSRAPRVNQAVVGVGALLAAIFGWPLLWALLSLQLFLGLTLGRRYCLTCLAYFTLIQPRFGEGELEDSRPPRLANIMGCVFLGAAAAAWWLGAPTAGTVLGAIVAALALLAASVGFCAGCEIYKLSARLRGISPRRAGRIEPADFGAVAADGAPAGWDASAGGGSPARAYVEFTHPLCGECREWERKLGDTGEPLHTIDVRERPDLARKYGIAVVPTVLAVAPDGRVLERLAP